MWVDSIFWFHHCCKLFVQSLNESALPVLKKIQNWFATLLKLTRLIFAKFCSLSVVWVQWSKEVGCFVISCIHSEWFLPHCLKWENILFQSWQFFVPFESLWVHQLWRNKFLSNNSSKNSKNENLQQNQPTYSEQCGEPILNFLQNW